jgi:hypothetical protein
MSRFDRGVDADLPLLWSQWAAPCPSDMSRSAYSRPEGSDSAIVLGLGVEDARGMAKGCDVKVLVFGECQNGDPR